MFPFTFFCFPEKKKETFSPLIVMVGTWQTFSQLCVFNYDTKNVEVRHAPWYIEDEPRFAFRGLLLGKKYNLKCS